VIFEAKRDPPEGEIPVKIHIGIDGKPCEEAMGDAPQTEQ